MWLTPKSSGAPRQQDRLFIHGLSAQTIVSLTDDQKLRSAAAEVHVVELPNKIVA
jgi:hypothetical protein